jgi:peptidyl-prolyl cis-trans isomerase C
MISWLTGSKWRPVAILALFVLVVAGAGKVAYDRVSELPHDAVFRYDDTVVTEDELQERVEILGATYGVQRPDDAEGSAEFDADAAKSMAVSMILEKAAADHGIEISDRTAQTELDHLIEDQLVGGRESFVEFLSETGISEQDVLDEIKRQLATSQLVEELIADVPEPTDEEVRAAYDEHRDSIVTPEARELRNIVVKNQVDARRVAQLARTGQDFASLASTWSRDGSTRRKGGSLGLVTAAQLDPTYANAAFSAARGAVFGPVRSQYGWNVGLVVGIREEKQLLFEEVQAQVKAELHNKERLAVWRDELGDLLEGADVEYADDYRPEDPTAPPSGVVEPTEGTQP